MKELDEILKEIADQDLYALLASLNEPPIEVLLREIHDSTEQILREFRDLET